MDRLRRAGGVFRTALLVAAEWPFHARLPLGTASERRGGRAAVWVDAYCVAQASFVLIDTEHRQELPVRLFGHTKKPRSFESGAFEKMFGSVARLAAAAELVLELLDAAGGVDEALLTGEGGVRIGGDIADHDLVIDAVDGFRLAATHGGASEELVPRGDVDERDRIELRMEISFHSDRPSNKVIAECRS